MSPVYGAPELADLSLAELTSIEVTTVAKRATRLADASASIYVIDDEAIQRSGARTLPEILRLAPNLLVAQLDAVQYSVSARGFMTGVSNKLLVLVDGRTIYSPLFSGVFWEMHDLVVEDIARIEVISGPGATLWGANAVNGVINVITKSAVDTVGWLSAAAAGNAERSVAMRYGGHTDTGAFRVFARHGEWDNTARADGSAFPDEWSRSSVGFRADWQAAANSFTVSGGVFDGASQHRGFVGPFELSPHSVSGAHLLGRWKRVGDDGSTTSVQAYLDHSEREEIVLFSPTVTVFDIEINRGISRGRHEIVYGAGARRAHDDIQPGFLDEFDPPSIELDWYNVFINDQYALSDSLDTALGIKLEWNEFSGLDPLPSARFGWRLNDRQLLWGALSRAARAPARLDRDVRFPGAPPGTILGGPDIRSEIAMVYELGYRAQPTSGWTFAVTAFHHDWDDLRSNTAVPVIWENRIEGHVTGFETWSSFEVMPAWLVRAGFVTYDKSLRLDPASTDPLGTQNPVLHNDPDYHWRVQSSFELPRGINLDLYFRGVDELAVQPVPAYTELDMRIAWRASPAVELYLWGTNLLQRSHPELGAASSRTEFGRSIQLGIRYTP